MIECESCERHFNPDDIQKCPNCDKELCEGCYQNHVKKCIDMEDSD